MAEAAIKKVPTQAERQAQISAEVQESNSRILDFVRGAVKAATTDLPGLVLDVIDFISGDTKKFGEKDRSAQMFEKATGSKSTGSDAEKLGGFADPKSLLKAIIVPAFLTRSLRDVKTADRAYKAGIDSAKVEDATGIFRLPENIDDGILRTVIHPGLAEFNPRALNFESTNITGTRALEDVINFPELQRLVPDMFENYRLVPEPGLPMNNAYHNSKNRVIGVGNASSKEDLMKSILHEIQHGIQTRFDMNNGASPAMFYQNVNAANRALRVLQEKSLQGDKKAMTDFYTVSRIEDQAVSNYKKVAGEAEARAVEKMRSEYGSIKNPITYYGDAYDLNRMIVSPSQVPKVDSDPSIRKIIDEALASQKK